MPQMRLGRIFIGLTAIGSFELCANTDTATVSPPIAADTRDCRNHFGAYTPDPQAASIVQNHFGTIEGLQLRASDLNDQAFSLDGEVNYPEFPRRLPLVQNLAIHRAQDLGRELVRGQKLPPGTYNFVITRSGKFLLSVLRDRWEVGAKHVFTAWGEEALIAGQIGVPEAGPYVFNFMSGGITRVISTRSAEFDTRAYEGAGTQALQYFMGDQVGRFIGTTYLKLPLPNLEQIRGYCAMPEFKRLNSRICARAA